MTQKSVIGHVPPTNVSNIKDPRVAAVVRELPSWSCRCFDRESPSVGHDVVPKCRTILLAEKIIHVLDKLEEPT